MLKKSKNNQELLFGISPLAGLMLFPIIIALLNIDNNFAINYGWFLLLFLILFSIIFIYGLLTFSTKIGENYIQTQRFYSIKKYDKASMKQIVITKWGFVKLITQDNKKHSLIGIENNHLELILEKLNIL